MTMQMIPEVTRTVEQAAWFHGIGKQTQPDVLAAIHKDIKALSDFLGEFVILLLSCVKCCGFIFGNLTI